jgi:hypothetical protein
MPGAAAIADHERRRLAAGRVDLSPLASSSGEVQRHARARPNGRHAAGARRSRASAHGGDITDRADGDRESATLNAGK